MNTMKKEKGAPSGGVWWWVAFLIKPPTACLLPTGLPKHWLPRLCLRTFAHALPCHAPFAYAQFAPPFSQFSAQMPSPLRRPSRPLHPKSHPQHPLFPSLALFFFMILYTIISDLYWFIYLLSLSLHQNRSTTRSGILYKFSTFLSSPLSI